MDENTKWQMAASLAGPMLREAGVDYVNIDLPDRQAKIAALLKSMKKAVDDAVR